MRRTLCGAALGAALALTTALPAASVPGRAPRYERVDTGGDGGQFSTYVYGGQVSANGRYAAFTAVDPAPDCPASGFTCAYLKDLRTGELIRVPGTAYYTSGVFVSADARTVAYSSGDRFTMPYVYDRVTGLTRQLWPDPPPEGPRYDIGTAQAVSADGRYVAYSLAGRTPTQGSVLYVRDLVTGTDEQVTPSPAAGTVTDVLLGAHGRTVAYGLLVAGAGGRTEQVHVRDLDSGETRRADADAYGSTGLAGLSGDGRWLVLDSTSPDGAHTARLVDSSGGRARRIGPDGAVAVAADGSARHVLLARGDALSLLDVRTSRRTPVASSGLALPGAVSRGGREVVFRSEADDLVPGDTNALADVFVRRTR
ncbi:hypothetical protein ACWCQK_24775 [Streptomyces sp. NPDC002306]